MNRPNPSTISGNYNSFGEREQSLGYSLPTISGSYGATSNMNFGSSGQEMGNYGNLDVSELGTQYIVPPPNNFGGTQNMWSSGGDLYSGGYFNQFSPVAKGVKTLVDKGKFNLLFYIALKMSFKGSCIN